MKRLWLAALYPLRLYACITEDVQRAAVVVKSLRDTMNKPEGGARG